MRLFGAIALGAIGVVLLIAGANGSAQQLYKSVFGKGLPNTTDIPNPALTKLLGNGIGGPATTPMTPTGPPGAQLPTGVPNMGTAPGTHNFAGVNSLTGAGIAV